MESVPVGHDVDRFLDQILGSDPIGPFAVKMDVVQVVMAIEAQFGIEVPDDAAEHMTTVSDAVKAIQEAIGAKNK